MRRSTKGSPQPAVAKASPAPTEPDGGERARGRGGPVRAGGSGAGARPPLGAGLGECPPGPARRERPGLCERGGGFARHELPVRRQGRAARLPLGCLALPPPRRFPGTPRPAGCVPGAGMAPERPGLRAKTCRVCLPLSPASPQFQHPAGKCVPGFGVVTGLKNLQAVHISGLKYIYNIYLYLIGNFFFFFACLVL